MNVIVLGMPGSGKGTHSKLLAKEFGLEHFSTGDVLRNEIAEQTDLGNNIKQYVDKGQLVPDDLMVELVVPYLTDRNGVVLDGFPRTLEQARALEAAGFEDAIDWVILLDVSEETVMKRLLNRGRADDKEEIIKERIDLFNRETMPVVAYYAENHPNFIVVDSNGEIDEVQENIRQSV